MLEDYDPFEKEKKEGIPSEVLAEKYIEEAHYEQEKLKRELGFKPNINLVKKKLKKEFSES